MTYQATEHLELTSFQKELWLAHLALPGKHPGIASGGLFAIKECPDRETICEVLKYLKTCFPLITATLCATNGRFPAFKTGVHMAPDLTFKDFRSSPDPETAARQWIETFKEKPFSPLGGNLYRCALIYLRPDLSWFINYCFHLAGDGIFLISQTYLMMACYDALTRKKSFQLPPVPSWQADVAEDRAHQKSPSHLEQKDEWKKYLQGLPSERIFTPRIKSSASRIGTANDSTGTVAHFEDQLSAKAAGQIRELSNLFGVNLSHICIVLHMAVLSRRYDATRINVQVPLRFGERRDFTKIQGHRVHIAPLIAEIDASTCFTSLIKDTRNTFKHITKLTQTPFQEGLRCLNKGQDMSHIWDTNINFFPYIVPKESKYHLRILGNISSRYEPILFGVYLIEQANCKDISVNIEYQTDYFSALEVEQYVRRLEASAHECLNNPDTLFMSRDGLLPEEEIQLCNFQTGPAFDIKDRTIPACFDDTAATVHDRPAVKNQTDGCTQNYGALREQSDRIGTWLVNQGLSPGQVAAVITRRHPDLPAIILGIMKAGGIYLPVDPDYPAKRVKYMLTDSGAQILLSTEPFDTDLESNRSLELDSVPIPKKLPPADFEKLAGRSVDPAAPAYLIYTSGSTGQPKGVLVAHRGFVNMILQQIAVFGQTVEDRGLQFASPSFDASMAEIFAVLLSGGCLYPVSRELIDHPVALKKYMEDHTVSVATFPPSYLRLFGKTPFKGLKILITAGAPPILEDARYYGKQLRYFNAYGPTEASVCAMIHRFDPDAGRMPGTIGRPIGNTRAYILDSRGRRKSPGLAGELCLGGRGLAIGYLNRPDLTEERFALFPLLEETPLYRTGDLAAWSETGDLILLGRKDDQLKIRGHRIEPGEINQALETHPHIAHAACIGVTGPDGAMCLHAFVVPDKKSSDTVSAHPESLMEHLSQVLPAHMIPSRFHTLGFLPVSPTGKVDKKALEVKAMELQALTLSAGEMPQKNKGSARENEIRRIFENILKQPVSDFHADFFALGGDSLLAIELSNRIFDRYRHRIPIRKLMKKATVHFVAMMVEPHKDSFDGDSDGSTPRQSFGEISLNQGQQGIWAQEMTFGPSAGYNMPFAVEIQTDEGLIHRFCETLYAAFQAQPGFWCHVKILDDQPVLKISTHRSFDLEQVDLRQMSAADTMAAQWFDQVIHTPFELNAPPLFRAGLARLSDDRWQLILVFHHIIADGRSIGLLINTCLAGMTGKPPEPVAETVLDRFVRAEQVYLGSPEGQEDLAFWKKMLEMPPPRLDLFHTLNRPATKSRDGVLVRHDIPDRAAQNLRHLASETGATLLGCFTGLILEFLKDCTGNQDMALCVPVGLRDAPILEKTAGYFANLMVVRSLPAEKRQDLTARIRRNWTDFRTAAAHSRYPFSLLTETLGLEKDASRWPVADIIATHIDITEMLPAKGDIPGVSLRFLDLPFRGAKADYTFILHTRQNSRMALILEYDIHIATAAEAESLAARFIRYIETATQTIPVSSEPIASDETADTLTSGAEQLLCRAWERILGIRISAGDPAQNKRHFLMDGGDSIKAIQMAGFLNQNGIQTMTPARIFKTPLFKDLKTAIQTDPGPHTPFGDVAPLESGEEIPLLPLHAWLFKHQSDGWENFYMILPMQISSEVDITRIPKALHALAHTHEAFHLSFEAPGKARFNQSPAPPVYEELEILGKDAVPRGAQRLFNRLDPTRGRVFGAILVQSDTGRFLIFGGHHLVLDAVSLDICARDIAHFCKSGQLTAKPGPGMATWAKALSRAGKDLSPPQEIEFWRTVCSENCGLLSRLNSDGDDRPSKRQIIRKTLRPGTYYLSSKPGQDLLATLGWALHDAGQDTAVFVTLEGHGRETVSGAPDVGQAAGWFTTVFPIVLKPFADLEDLAADLANKFRRLPKNGLGYGIACQQFPQDPALRYRSQITLNYLGRFFSQQEMDGFLVLPEFTSPSALPQLLPPNYRFDSPMDIRVCVLPDGCLELELEFSDTCLDPSWVRRLSDGWVAALNRAAESDNLESTAKCRPDEVEETGTPLLNQEGMLFQSLIEKENQSTYTQQINFRLRGEINIPRFQQAWQTVLNRHKALRTLYPYDRTGIFHCLTLKRARAEWQIRDLSDLLPSEQTAMRDSLLSYSRKQGFNLSCGPLIRTELFVFDQKHHEFSLCFHHILMDGWCIGIILEELFAAYTALCRNREIDLAPAPDPAAFRQFLTRFDKDAAKRYWTRLLEGFSSPTFLTSPGSGVPYSHPFEGELSWTLDEKTTQLLKSRAAEAGISWASLIQAAWAVLLGKTGNTATCRDTVFGIISSGRPPQIKHMEKTVGLFIQTLPVRVKWQMDTPILGLAKAVNQEALNRSKHEYYLLADIQHDVSLSPLLDHILVFETYPFEFLENTDETISKKNPIQVTEDAPKITGITGYEKHPYALSLSVIPGRCLTFRITSGALPISEFFVNRIRQNLETILTGIGKNPDIRCNDLESLVETPHTGVKNVCTRFKEIASQFLNDTALMGEDDTPWTYEKLDQISSRIANGLGNGPAGRPIAFFLPRSPMAAAVMLGILKAKAAYLFLDEKNPFQRTCRIMEIAGCRTVILSRDFPEKDPLENHFDCLYFQDLIQAAVPADDNTSDFDTIDPEQPAYIMFTSGSTGEPKGVVIPHRAIVNLVIDNDFWHISSGERMLQTGPLGFDASTLEIWGPLLNGGTTCFIHNHDLLSPARLEKKISWHRITLMWLTASLCNLLTDENPNMFAPLRRLFVGGEALSPSHMKRIKAACPDLELINGYGPTENTTFTTTHPITHTDIQSGRIPIGTPISNTRVHILDADHAPVADGEWGEICIAGQNLALGYIGQPELTRQVFVDLPVPVGETVYKTGDIGRRRADGIIEYKGRKDVQVKVRGYRIELSEIETAIKTVPWVKNAVVLAPRTGEYRSLAGWVQADPTQMPGHLLAHEMEEELKQHLKEILPSYMIPDTIQPVPRFPVTANGKLDRKQLEKTFLAAGSSLESTDKKGGNDTRAVVSLSRIEEKVAQVFSQVLDKPVSGRDADFFQLGGQSLRAMRMILRLNHTYGIELTVSEVMKKGQVKKIARLIHTLTSAPANENESIGPEIETLAPIPVTDSKESYPMSPGQERLWFLQRMAPENPVYSVPFIRRITGRLDMNALQQAVTVIETRHDALRLRVPDTFSGQAPTQKIALPGQIRVVFKDCSQDKHPEKEAATQVQNILETAFSFGYDHPLFRVMVFKENRAIHVLMLHLHHIICDGWSAKILLDDLFNAYEDATGQPRENHGRTDRSESLSDPLRYVDYAVWQKKFLETEKGRDLVNRCTNRLKAAFAGPDVPVLNLPGSGRKPAIRSHKGAVLSMAWTREQETALSDLAAAEQATLFSVLLTLVKIFVYRHTGQKDILVGFPAAGRSHWQTENMVGFFVNTLVLRTEISLDIPFKTLLNQVNSLFGATLTDQACPFEALVEHLDLERDPLRNPLFNVFVAFEDREWNDPMPPAGLKMDPYPFSHSHSKFDISFYFRQTADGLCMDIEYSTDLFTAQDISAMAKRFFVMARQAVRHPDQSVNALPLMPETERQKVVYTFNDTYAHVDFDQTIDRLFRNQAARNNHAVALKDDAGNVLTFGELDRQVRHLSRHFASHGVKKQTPVCLCFERGFDLIVSIFALMRLSAVYVPVVPELPRERLASMAADLGPCTAYCRNPDAFRFQKVDVPVIPWFDTFCDNNADIAKTAFAPVNDTAAVITDPCTPAYVIFTSGSTGRPKGVCIQHRSVVNRIQWMQSCFPLDETDVILQKTSISFDVSIWELFWWSWTGASLVPLSPGAEKDPEAIVRAIKHHRVTVIHFVPSMLRIFLSHIRKHPKRVSDLQSLKHVFASGEALTPELVSSFNALVSDIGNARLHNLYGPTEATVDVTWYPCPLDDIPGAIPIGKPVSNTRAYILDNTLQPVPIGVTGDIYLAGIQVAQGYVNRPELNEKCFLPDPFVPANRMYRTGDLGRWLPSGDVEYLGRNDNQIKLRGFRIELGEVETALERIPAVSQAIVRKGTLGGEPCLEAFLVCPDHVPLSLETVRKEAGKFMPGYMIPSLFYRLEQVPLNLSGKTDRNHLKGRPMPAKDVPGQSLETTDPVERQVQKIWQQVLPETEPMDIHQAFFEVGGTSLLAVRLYELLNDQWPGLFTIANLFIHTTVEKQARHIREKKDVHSGVPSPEKTKNTGIRNHGTEKKEPIAIIGMALRLADYDDPETLWSDLSGQVDHTGPMSDRRAEELIHTLAALGNPASRQDLGHLAFLEDISSFDCRRFGMAPADIALTDPEQRLFLETAFRALEDAGYGPETTTGQAVGVFAGASPSYVFKDAVSKTFPDRAEQGFILNLPSAMAARPGYLKDWRGPACVVDTACSSSLTAVLDACRSLIEQGCDMALAGGAKVMMAPVNHSKKFTIQSTDGRTRPFDALASGVGAGEGAVVFLLKPLSRALADKDAIRAVILGGSVNQDGRSAGMAAPNPLAQAHVIHAASRNAGIDLTSLDFFEAHGTATPIGDPIEIEGISRAFDLAKSDGHPPQKTVIPISSVKGHFGHLDAAAGALGMARAVLCLEHGTVPAQIHFSAPNPNIDFDRAGVFVPRTPVFLPPENQPWRCGISAFGLSGINAHLILEQAPASCWGKDGPRFYGICLSAASSDALCRYVEAVLTKVSAHPQWPVSAIAGTLVCGRDHLPVRMAVVADTHPRLMEKLLEWRLNFDDSQTADQTPIPVSQRTRTIPFGGFDDADTAQKTVQAYLEGENPVWPESEPFFRLHLPVVPLERFSCWPDFGAGGQETTPFRHRFLGKKIHTRTGWVFSVPIHDDGFWPISEHRLHDRTTLVGMAVVSLFLEAFDRITGAKNQTGLIRQLSWLHPVVSDYIAPDSVSITLCPKGKDFFATLSGCDHQGTWMDFATATLCEFDTRNRDAKKNQPPLDLDKVLSDLTVHETAGRPGADDAGPRTSAIRVGQRWHCRTHAWRGTSGRRKMARLKLPNAFHTDLNQIRLHPAMMDVAASLGLDRPGMLPVGFKHLTQYQPLSADVFTEAVATTAPPETPQARETLTFDCTVWDADTGQCILFLTGLTFVKALLPAPRIHAMEWVRLEHPPRINNHDHSLTRLMILAESRAAHAQMQQIVSTAQKNGYRVQGQTLPEKENDRAAVVKQVAEDQISHILWLPAACRGDRWALPSFLQGLCRQGFNHPVYFVAAGQGALNGPHPGKKKPEIRECRKEPAVDAALTLGIMLAMNQEEPLLSCRYIEMDGPVTSDVLLDEVLASADHPVSPVFLDDKGNRYARKISLPLTTDNDYPAMLEEKGCVVFTGGLGAMSLTLARGVLSKMGAASVALLHRGDFSLDGSDTKNRVARFRNEQLTRIKMQGGTVKCFRCDVTCKPSLSDTLNQVRQELGPILGIVHTAGVPGDGFLIRKTRQFFESVLAPKVDGLRHLHDLTLKDPLCFFVMASSRTALTGAPGQTDYTAANAWMDAFAHWRAGQGLPALVINWNTWAKVGMAAWKNTPALPGSTLQPESAVPLLGQALASGQVQVVVTMPDDLLDTPVTYKRSSMSITVSASDDHTFSKTDDPVSLEQQILIIITQTLGYETLLSPEDDFYALGGDSITGMQVINRINEKLGLTASVADLFIHSRLKDFTTAVNDVTSSRKKERFEFTAPGHRETYPVNQEQFSVLKMTALSLPNTGYNLPHFLKLTGDVRHKDIETALKQLIHRHEILRTVFVDYTSETPAMRILAPETVCDNFSLKRRTITDFETSAPGLIQPFEPDRLPLFRTVWLDIQSLGPVLFFDIYHGLADAKTIEILLCDLFSIWQKNPLSPVVHPFKDAAWHQYQTPEDPDAKAYWLNRFKGDISTKNPDRATLPTLNLPGDKPRPKIHTFTGENHRFEVPDPWLSDMRQWVREQNTTTHVLLLSLWALLLSKMAQTPEPVIAVAADSRTGERYESVAGMFASLLPLKIEVGGHRFFKNLLKHTHQVLADALRHRSFPLNRLLEELKPPMDPGRTHLSEVTFSYMNVTSEQRSGTASDAKTGNARQFERIHVLNPACKGDISIFATDTGDQLSFVLEYYADYFSAARISHMENQFLFLLKTVIDHSGKTDIKQISLPYQDTHQQKTHHANTDVREVVSQKMDLRETDATSDILSIFRQFFQKKTLRATDSFFDLGGHSLLGLQIINRINEKWRMSLSIRDLFENPSPAALAETVSGRQSDDIIPIEAAPPSALAALDCPPGCYPLSHAQQRLYVLHHTKGGKTAYNMPFIFECDTLLDTHRFARALEQVCTRHEILRTRLIETDTGIWQKIDPRVDCAPDIHHFNTGERGKALALFADRSARPFDPACGPLFKTVVCHMGDRNSMILLLMHHIIGDGWSMQVFFRDLLNGYTKTERGTAGSLPPLTIQYKDFAFWQQRQNWGTHAAYWKKQLDRAPGRINLPVDGSGNARTLPAQCCKQELSADQLHRINTLARQKGVSLATLLFTLFSTLLYRLTRQPDMIIGMGIAGRETRDLEDLIGFFVNILPIRVCMDDDTSLWDLLDQVHQTFLEALEHQTYPFDLLVRDVSPDRSQQMDPLVNVMFEYQRYQDLNGINPETSAKKGTQFKAVDLSEEDGLKKSPGPTARHDLTFFVQDTPDGCLFKAEYDPGILTRETVETWLNYFDMILENVVPQQTNARNMMDTT